MKERYNLTVLLLQLILQLIYFFTYFYLLILIFLVTLGLLAMRRLSLVAVGRGYSSFWWVGFSVNWFLLWSTASGSAGFSSYGTQA